MSHFDYKEMLENTAEQMMRLAEKLHEDGTETLDSKEKELLKMAGFGVMKDIMEDIEMAYMVGRNKDLHQCLDSLGELFTETL